MVYGAGCMVTWCFCVLDDFINSFVSVGPSAQPPHMSSSPPPLPRPLRAARKAKAGDGRYSKRRLFTPSRPLKSFPAALVGRASTPVVLEYTQILYMARLDASSASRLFAVCRPVTSVSVCICRVLGAFLQ